MDENNETEIEEIEISLDAEEIDDWIVKLDDLKETKQPITVELDDETELKINLEQENDTD